MPELNIANLKADLNALHDFAVTAHDAIVALRDKLARAIGLAEAMPDNTALQAELDAMDNIVKDASSKLAGVIANSPATPPGTAPIAGVETAAVPD